MRYWAIPVAAFVLFSILLNQVMERLLHFSFVEALRGWMAAPGIGAAIVIMVLLASDIFLPIPSSIVMVLSGVLFGSFWGGLFSLVGSLGGNLVGFELMRRYGWRVCHRFVDETQVKRMQPTFERFGASAVIVSRPVPVMMETLTFVAGLMNMGRGRFVLASVIGTAPIAFLYARGGAASWSMSSIVPAVFVLVCIPAAGWLIAHRRFHTREQGIHV